MSRASRAVKRNAGIHPTSRAGAYASSGRGTTMKPSQAVGPRGVRARPGRGTPLPPKGAATAPGSPKIMSVKINKNAQYKYPSGELVSATLISVGGVFPNFKSGMAAWIHVDTAQFPGKNTAWPGQIRAVSGEGWPHAVYFYLAAPRDNPKAAPQPLISAKSNITYMTTKDNLVGPPVPLPPSTYTSAKK